MGKFGGISNRGSNIVGSYGRAGSQVISQLRWQLRVAFAGKPRLSLLQHIAAALFESFHSALLNLRPRRQTTPTRYTRIAWQQPLHAPLEAIFLVQPVETEWRRPLRHSRW
ncbi:hypothetical protein [Rhizobium lusitanum]|uniref:hypothetical protein n=1 Tax=Rhizobium lusitanum TaxID=293958 RepID=UPI00195CFCDF|nr:hypothetical protein [Rhizobium lusitanum]MBM7047485.1 hypothetical protein [Rhizobium lusitanum]